MNTPITRLARFTRFALGLVAAGTLAAPAMAAQAGLRSYPVANDGGAATPVALYYPTDAAERSIPMGPFTARVAPGGTPVAQMKGLIVISHGTGGSEAGHGSLAEALARQGYLVAALRHPGDNWQDRSLLQAGPTRYFGERPRQISRVIDAVLRDPEWSARIASDAQGPRVGAVGHSAGGYSVMALAGGQFDGAQFQQHCSTGRAADPVFCGVGGGVGSAPIPAPAAPLRDARVRAVVAMAPVGAVFGSASLAAVTIPVRVYAPGRDTFLVPRFHGERVGSLTRGAEFVREPEAGHFAFMDTPSMPIPTEDGDAGANPPGFDRAAFLARLGRELPAFFDRSFGSQPTSK